MLNFAKNLGKERNSDQKPVESIPQRIYKVRGVTTEKVYWVISIILIILSIILAILYFTKCNIMKTTFVIGYIFLLIHMIGNWVSMIISYNCGERKDGSLLQYFKDNILGNLCRDECINTDCSNSRIVVNRNLSIIFLTAFIFMYLLSPSKCR